MAEGPARPTSLRFVEAFGLAEGWHRLQERKGTGNAYLLHPMGVASIVLERGGDEDEAIGALLHDAAEDPPPELTGRQVLDRIRERFGERVEMIVAGCSDSLGEHDVAKPPWRERKEAYLARLPTEDRSVVRVCSADKLHNARAMRTDLRSVGPEVWGRFTTGRDEQTWYFGSLLAVFGSRRAEDEAYLAPIVDELERVTDELFA
jgi:(p)ppGpp synthase/HD superfamily hydrolase